MSQDNLVFEASYAQERLWFITRLEGDGSAYHVPMALRITGRLNPDAMAAAFRDIAARHETLRTHFAVVDGAPCQVVAEVPHTLTVHDAREDAARAEAVRAAVMTAPFDLTTGPLFRAALLRLGPETHELLLNMHHIISDGWSLGILVHELTTLYRYHASGTGPFPLPDLPLQYGDFAEWQRAWFPTEQPKLEAYWRSRLDGMPHILELPVDKPGRTGAGPAGTVPFSLDAATVARLKGLQPGATLFMVLHAAFSVLLSRYSGRTDLAVGTPIAGRTRGELEPLIGFFVNTLVVRAQPAHGTAFRRFLADHATHVMEDFVHQDLPFEKLVELLQPERDMTRTPLFQVMLVLQNTPMTDIRLPELTLTPLPPAGRTTKFDLSLTLTEGSTGLQGDLEFNTLCYETVTARHMVQSLERLLTHISRNPDLALDRYSLLSDAQRHEMLHTWNDTAGPYPHEASIHALVTDQARARHDKIALIQGDVRVTYAALEAAAEAVAGQLWEAGIRPGDLVALHMPRSPEMIIGLLGILKLGAGYVPLDTTYPADRLAFMVADCDAALILTHGDPPDLPHPVRCLPVDTSHRAVAALPAVPSQAVAHIIYTSGSTGRPKGVRVSHRNVLRLVCRTNFARLDADQVFLQFAPLSFDLSTFEIWGSLVNGAQLVLAPPGTPSLEALGRVIADHRVTTLWLTAGLFHLMVDHRVEDLVHVRQLLAGGDVLSPEHCRRVLETLPDTLLINGYGPTENTTFTTTHPVRSLRGPGYSVPIGRPFANATTYLLDAHMEPLPVGVFGELLAGGDGVTAGYHNRPALTAEKFIPDPHGPTPGARLYRTGDLARYLPDGTLEFAGRLDGQVKLRGFRIEIGEAETALMNQNHVAQAVALVREADGDKQLAAYLVPTPGAALDPHAVRAALEASLPAYLVPNLITVLDVLPLTPNGKPDRKALAAMAVSGADTGGYAAPASPLEEDLCAMYAEVFKLERVGVRDHFFHLGGHSLLATRVVALIGERLQITLPVSALFQAPTPAALAALIRRSAAEPALPPLTPRPGAPNDAVPLSFQQRRLWFLYQLDGPGPAYNVAMALQLHGALSVRHMHEALMHLTAAHPVLRLRFDDHDGAGRQRIADVPPPAPRLVDLSALSPAHRDRAARDLAAAESAHAFRLETEAPVRFCLIRTHADTHLLLVTLHHLVTDGWSLDLLAAETARVYRARLLDEPLSPDAAALHYLDYTHWQHTHLQTTYDTQLHYWRRRLAGLPEELTLPTDRPRPKHTRGAGEVHVFALDAEQTAAVARFSQAHDATPFMTLITAFALLLQRTSRQNDLAVGIPIAGRRHPGVADMVGFFANTLVLRFQPDPHASAAAVLAQTRTDALDAYRHQDLPFELLVEALQPERALNRAPLFQVMFSLQNASRGDIALPGIRATRSEAIRTHAQFDLTLTLTEHDDLLEGAFEYDSDLFDAVRIAAMADQYRLLLDGLLQRPQVPVHSLPLLSAETRNHLLHQFGKAPNVAPTADTFPRLFAARAARCPRAPAVHDADGTLTYAALHARVDALAGRLRARGVWPGAVVAVQLPHGAAAVTAFLAVMRAGAAYVPLDPAYPADRRAYMLADSGASHVVAQHNPGTDLPVVSPDAPYDDAPHPPLPHGHRADAAYVLYTSGTTGRPKGVVVTQGALACQVTATGAAFGLSPADRVLQFAALSFDVAAEELYASLAHGAAVYPRPPHLLDGFAAFDAFLAENNLTVVNLPSPYWHGWIEFLEEKGTPPAASLRLVVVGSDRVAPDAPARWQRLCAHPVPWVNAYGTTETTITSTLFPSEAWDGRHGEVPIGRPVGDATVRVVDPHLQLVPVGVEGELCFGGTAPARGYLGRPGLTAEKFVPDPFGAPGARLYRTGDRARFTADGHILFHGRIDHQIKIRGFRVEPQEIAAVLCRMEDVVDALVLLDTDGTLPRLVAFVHTRRPDEDLTADRQAFLQAHLPDYMVPEVFVPLAEMPLTEAGKVDRRALPRPNRAAAATYAPPADALETAVATVWQEVLDLPRIGRGDHFFKLGGHSLAAARAVSRLARRLDVPLTVRHLFEAPTPEALARVIADLTPSDAAPQLVHHAETVHPLAPAQQRLWFLHCMKPGPLFNMPGVLHLRGPAAPLWFGRAVNRLLARHEALRTFFPSVDDQVSMDVLPVRPHALPVVDVSAAPDPNAAAHAVCRAALGHTFDLGRRPPHLIFLIRLAAGDHVLVVNLHHILSDGLSMDILVRELTEDYAAFAVGTPVPRAPLPFTYGDYARAQLRQQASEAAATQKAFWHKRLQGLPPLLNLPTRAPRPAVAGSAGAALPVTIGPALKQALLAAARDHDATLFMVLTAGFAAVAARYSGQTDLCLGTTLAGRRHPDLEDVIGFFVNTLPLRMDLSARPSFGDLTARTRHTVLEAFTHGELPFDQIVACAEAPRSTAHAPLFQAMITLQVGARETPAPAGLTVVPFAVETTTAQFDLTLSLIDDPDAVRGALIYRTDLFDQVFAARFLAHYLHFLEQALAAPATPFHDVPLLDARERRTLLHDLARGEEVARAPLPLHMLQAAAEAHADQTAVVHGDRETTYAALAARAAAVAAALRPLMGRGEPVVAVLGHRCPDLIAAQWGVHLAGGAWMPLDPDAPEDRQLFQIEDAAAAALVLAGDVAAPACRLPVLRVDACPPAAPREAPSPDPDNLAYLIYTSGSTGRPKGVAVTHGTYAGTVHGWCAAYGLTSADRGSQLACVAFDASVIEVWPFLSLGATVCQADAATAADPHRLQAWLLAQRVSQAFVPTPMAELLGALAWPARTPLRRLIAAGDKLQAYPPAELPFTFYNNYGPTENTVVATIEALPARAPATHHAPPLGAPSPGTHLYVLDAHLQPVPCDVPGELCLGGGQTARGYLGRPALTAACFVPDPFAASAGARLYRTGDLVVRRTREAAPPALDFLGRIDRQVKLRGFRIELGEIEAALHALPEVRDAAVVLTAQTAAPAAYVVPAADPAPDAAHLRTRLGRALPAYMVPTVLVFLPELPLTPNGKTDRRALADRVPEAPSAPATAPQTPLQAQILALFEAVLQRPGLGIDTHFFDAGGHSLLSVQLVARLRAELHLPVALEDLFTAPTPRALAERCDRPTGEASHVVPLNDRTGTPLFLVHALSGSVLPYRQLAARLPYPVYGLQAPSVPANPETLEDLAARYLSEVRRRQPHGPYTLGGWSLGGLIAHEMAAQLAAAGETVAHLVLIDTYTVPETQDTRDVALLHLIGRDLIAAHRLPAPDVPADVDREALFGLILEQGRRHGLWSAEEGFTPLNRLLRLYRHHLTAALPHRPKQTDVPITLYTTDTYDAVQARAWARRCHGPFVQTTVAGDHDELLHRSGPSSLAARLHADLSHLADPSVPAYEMSHT